MIATDQAQHLLSGGGNVVDSDGDKIGSIGQVFLDDRPDSPEWVTVKTGLFGMGESFVPLRDAEVTGNDIRVPYTKDKVKDAPRIADADGHLDESEEASSTPTTASSGRRLRHVVDAAVPARPAPSPTGDDHGTRRATTPRAQHRHAHDPLGGAAPRRHRDARGRAAPGCASTSSPRTSPRRVPVSHEEVRLEREPITDANRGEALSGGDITEEEHEVVLNEERVVVDKETVPVERVRVDKETVTEEQQVDERSARSRSSSTTRPATARPGRDRRDGQCARRTVAATLRHRPRLRPADAARVDPLAGPARRRRSGEGGARRHQDRLRVLRLADRRRHGRAAHGDRRGRGRGRRPGQRRQRDGGPTLPRARPTPSASSAASCCWSSCSWPTTAAATSPVAWLASTASSRASAVWLWAIVVAIVVAVLGAVAGAEFNVLSQLNSFPRIPVSEGNLTTGGIIALVAVARRQPGGRHPRRPGRHAVPPQGRPDRARRLTHAPAHPTRGHSDWSAPSSASRSVRPQARRIRIGPLAVDGSTTRPPWVIWTSPRSTSRRAARRAGSISSRQASRHSPRPRAASDGQMVARPARWASRSVMVASRRRSTSLTPRLRHDGRAVADLVPVALPLLAPLDGAPARLAGLRLRGHASSVQAPP